MLSRDNVLKEQRGNLRSRFFGNSARMSGVFTVPHPFYSTLFYGLLDVIGGLYIACLHLMSKIEENDSNSGH